jgi:hypothetical protein
MNMQEEYELGSRIAILGRGGADATPAATRLAHITGRPIIRIDKHFWPVDRRPQPAPHWAQVQDQINSSQTWVLDADLGPFDIDEPRLGHPDEVWVLDFSPLTCLVRALRYPAERRDVRVWLFRWRREYLLDAVRRLEARQPDVRLRRFTSPAELGLALAEVDSRMQSTSEPA